MHSLTIRPCRNLKFRFKLKLTLIIVANQHTLSCTSRLELCVNIGIFSWIIFPTVTTVSVSSYDERNRFSPKNVPLSQSCEGRTNFAKQKNSKESKKTKRFAFQRNGFRTSEYTQSNQNKLRKYSIMVGCKNNQKSILHAANSHSLSSTSFFCFTKFTFANR